MCWNLEESRELCGRILHFLARVKICSWLSLAASKISGRFFPAAAVFLFVLMFEEIIL